MTADIDRITRGWAAQADELQDEATDLRREAQAHLDDAQTLAQKYLDDATRMAGEVRTTAEAEATKLRGRADIAEESAAHIRQKLHAERQAAELGDLPPATMPDGSELQKVTLWGPLIGQWVHARISDGMDLYGTLAGLDGGVASLVQSKGATPVRPPLAVVDLIEPVPMPPDQTVQHPARDGRKQARS